VKEGIYRSDDDNQIQDRNIAFAAFQVGNEATIHADFLGHDLLRPAALLPELPNTLR
jgi:hypothetical protein